MTDMADRTYPEPGSLGETLYGLTEEEMDERLTRIEGEPGGPPPLDFTALRTERVIGLQHWQDEDEGLVVTAQFEPLQTTPSALVLAVQVREDEFALARMKELGFQIPDSDPAYIVGGQGQHDRTTVWAPGPTGLVLLHYQAVGDDYPVTLQVYSEAPPEPEFSEQREKWEETIDWEGTLRFADQEAVADGKVEEHIPPGRIRARTIL